MRNFAPYRTQEIKMGSGRQPGQKPKSRSYRVRAKGSHYAKIKSACMIAEGTSQASAVQALWEHFCETTTDAQMAQVILSATKAQQVAQAKAELDRLQARLEFLGAIPASS